MVRIMELHGKRVWGKCVWGLECGVWGLSSVLISALELLPSVTRRVEILYEATYLSHHEVCLVV